VIVAAPRLTPFCVRPTEGLPRKAAEAERTRERNASECELSDDESKSSGAPVRIFPVQAPSGLLSHPAGRRRL